MRPGELLGLKWEDVDLDEGGLRLNRALTGRNLTTPKTKRSRRRIDLSAASIAALKAHRKRQLEERMRKAGLWRDHDLIFASAVGTPLSHRNVVRSFKALLKRAVCPPAPDSTTFAIPAPRCCLAATSIPSMSRNSWDTPL
jgi:integrase